MLQNKPSILIIGAGAFSSVVIEAINDQNKFEIIGLLDSIKPPGTLVNGKYPIIDGTHNLEFLDIDVDFFIIAIGDINIRKTFYEIAIKKWKAATIIHPKSYISSSATIGAGTLCLANSTVASNVKIGNNCLINFNVIVDHDSEIGQHSHLSIGSIISSRLKLKESCFTSIGEVKI